MIINDDELSALEQALSNDARTLYCIGLRPGANATTGFTMPLDYKLLLALLNGKENKFLRGRQLNSLIRELIQFNLVALPNELDINTSLKGQRVLLPKMITKTSVFSSVYENAHPLDKNWLPQAELFSEILSLMGIIDCTTNQEELGEFIVYWLGRPDVRLTEYQWTQRYAQHIKRLRTATGLTPIKRVGSQVIESPSSLEADDNAKRLVQKYAQRNKKPS